MKIVINTCYGGFSLSPKGERRYLELSGQNAYFYKQSKYKYTHFINDFIRIDNMEDFPYIFFYCTTYDQGKIISDYPNNIFNSRDIKRNDHALVQVVEELGEESFGKCAKLKVVNIKKGRWFKIDEYDGLETIQYRDIDDEWILAE